MTNAHPQQPTLKDLGGFVPDEVLRDAAGVVQAPEWVSRSLFLRDDLGSLDRSARTCTFVASTDAVDSYDEIVEQKWDLSRFAANPVILFAHQSRALPIGQATMCEVVKGELVCTVKFASAAANPIAEQVFQCICEGVLRAVSVGFYPREVRYEKRDNRDVYVLSDNELHEVSVVPVPANPECIARIRARAAGGPKIFTRRAGAEPTERSALPAAPELKSAPADAAGSRKDTTMATTEEMQATITQRDTQISTLTGSITAAEQRAKTAEEKLAGIETRYAVLEAQNTSLVTARDAAVANEKATKKEFLSLKVDGLVGTKILPTEKDMFVELAELDPALFEKMLAQRAPITVLDKVVPAEKSPTNTVADDDAPPTATRSETAAYEAPRGGDLVSEARKAKPAA